MKIVLIGAAGCGKSTLSAQVFATLKARGSNAELVDEFVRRDIQRHGPLISIWEQYRTRFHQKELEDAVPASVSHVIVDSGTLTPYFYATLYCDATDARQRLVLADMHRYLLDDLFLNRYDLIFYLPFQPGTSTEDGTRYQNSQELATLDAHMDLVFCNMFKTDRVHRIDGPFADRLTKVMAIIDAADATA